MRAFPPALAADDDSRGDPRIGGRDDTLDAHAALLAMLDSVASSPEIGPLSPPTTKSYPSMLTIS
jgi:hypothetical protein